MSTQPAYTCTACRTPITDTTSRVCPNCGVDFAKVAPTPVIGPPQVGIPAYPASGIYPPAAVDLTQPAAAPASRRGWVVLGAVIFAAIIAAAAFVGLTNSGLLVPHHTVTGSFDLDASDGSGISTSGSTCQGTDGYSDIAPGAGVTLNDGTGKILATTSLGSGSGDLAVCEFSFTLTDVPEVPFYSITVSHRGALSYSLSQMQSMGWTLSLKLGN